MIVRVGRALVPLTFVMISVKRFHEKEQVDWKQCVCLSPYSAKQHQQMSETMAAA